MTYGQLKFRLVKAFPGVDIDLIEGWIADRYAEILGELPWSRQNANSILQTIAPYADGTLTLNAGSTAVTGSATAFISAMTGRGLRVTGRAEIYQFTQLTGTTGTLDRPYEGLNGVGLGYQIFQHVYVMPSDCRMLQDDAFDGMRRLSTGTLTQQRNWPLGGIQAVTFVGLPTGWASYMDDGSTPPRLQVEVYPIPDKVYSLPFTYSADSSLPATGAAFLTWFQPAALVEGVTAKIKAHLKDYTGAQLHAVTAKAALANMRTSDAQGMGPMEMHLPSFYTAHRRRRW